ncbi:MAG TPA: branched-chain amino acid ABC transporter permease [Chitinivibrionales bacterium]|nr:branched-chain amino acid ABC transporter permease [Chitinivibrionales bacterium]
MESKKNHLVKLIIVLGIFIILQSLAGLLSPLRQFQYYSRIFFIIEINIILTVSLALINGFTGQFSLGHAGFMAIGAYTSAVITTVAPKAVFGSALSTSSIEGHLIFIFAVIAGGAIAGVFGLLIGFPSLRLRGDYLAIVTLAAGEVIRAGLRFFDVLGGPRGIPGIPAFSGAIYIGAFFFLSLWMMRNFIYSHYGRACIAVRDNEIAAASMGVNTTFQKVWAFVLGAFFAGIAGGLFAHMSRYINPDNFGFLKTLDILIFLYIGGPHSIAGSIVGAATFTVVPELLRLVNLESWRLVIYPLILILVMRFMRDGIMGEKEFGFLVPWKFKEMVQKRKNKFHLKDAKFAKKKRKWTL